MPRSEIWYVYGVSLANVDLRLAPEGLDDAAVDLCIEGEFAALVSRLDAAQYAPEAIEQATENVEWLAPRAVAHDRVLTWASDRGPTIPLPIFSLFSGEEAVRRMLRERQLELTEALRRTRRGREYALRVYRIDEELTKVAAELSPRLAQLQEAALSASPGQRYLLERKLDSERKNELFALGAQIAREVMDALRPSALESVEGRIVSRARSTGEAPLVLDAAFLVAPTALESFQRELTRLVTRHTSRGFRFDFTGPWPPYHFVQSQRRRGNDDA
jgi:hypothetical protein